MILSDLFQKIKNDLQTAGIETSALDARLLMCHALELSHEQFLLSKTRVLTEDETGKINEFSVQRLAGKPVSKIIGQKEFYGRNFKTTTDTLDPRPDSETLIEAVLAHKFETPKILDLGTGTGCLVLTLLAELPTARAIAVDQSLAALDVAKQNAYQIGVEDRVVFVQSDWFGEVVGQFDIIISNPPYIPAGDIDGLAKEVRIYDPLAALVGGEDGLDPYRIIIPQLEWFLKPGGLAAFELGQGQDAAVAEMLTNNGFSEVFTRKDLAGIPRVVGGILLQKPDNQVC
jgi:release factor glutamine methyltransferase